MARILASEDRLAEASAEVLVLPEGRVIRQGACPHVFDANLIRHPRLSLDGLDQALEALSAPLRAIGARHVQIACDEQPLDDAVAQALRRRGYQGERLLAMALPGAPARRADGAVKILAVEGEAPEPWYPQVMERMSRDEPWYSPRVSREIITSLTSKADAGVLALHVAALDRRPVGAAGLAMDAERGIAAITTVGTVPEARHRGVAQALVVTLAERAQAAGCDLVYLVARAEDTPKEMYRKLGFEVVHGFDVWLRPPQ